MNVLPEKPDLSGLPRLRFLTSLDFPPFNFADENKKPTGFNIDIARGICSVLEIEQKCEIQALPWSELQGALEGRRAEAIIAGNEISLEARQQFGLSAPYFRFPTRFIARKPDDASADLSDSFNDGLQGLTVAVQEGTAHEDFLKFHFPQAMAETVSSQQAGYDALQSGTVDYFLADGVSLSFYLTSPAADGCCVFASGPYLDIDFTGLGMAVAVRNEDTFLREAITYALAVMERNGRYREVFRRYFPLSPYAASGAGP
ncbi:MAG: transporter substrate-binding domain-containing protein [Pseudomonadota bacterium]